MKATLYRADVVLAQPVRAAKQDHYERTRIFLELEAGGVTGFGEVNPQPFALNGDPDVESVVEATTRLLELVFDIVQREGALPQWSRVAQLGDGSPARNAAGALLEMALLERELRTTSATFEALWPSRFETPSIWTTSILDDERLSGGTETTASRVRVKIAPGRLNARAADRLRNFEAPLLLDYNCSAQCDDDVLEQLDVVRAVANVVAIEQPYQVGNLVDHARLRSRLDVALSLDESVRSMRDLTHILQYGAASMLCVKTARVGGFANARTIIERARDEGLAVYVGGFFDGPYARSIHRDFARCFVDEPSDIAVGTEFTSSTLGRDSGRVSGTPFEFEPTQMSLEHATVLFQTTSSQS
jgi:L-alanine-DL-glutamate epimerase-like enolase superfamily enzyme